MSEIKQDQKGFTLLEILLVVAAIAILAGIVIFAVNPGRQLGETRNAQRRVDIRTIIDATYQYAIQTPSGLPANITSSPTEICKTNAPSCAGLVDLSVLTTDARYLTAMPIDPTETDSNSTGYAISKDDNGRITVSAPNAENSVTITVTR